MHTVRPEAERKKYRTRTRIGNQRCPARGAIDGRKHRSRIWILAIGRYDCRAGLRGGRKNRRHGISRCHIRFKRG